MISKYYSNPKKNYGNVAVGLSLLNLHTLRPALWLTNIIDKSKICDFQFVLAVTFGLCSPTSSESCERTLSTILC